MSFHRYKGVQRVVRTRKDGSEVVHYYLRSPRVKLPGAPGDLDFEQAYERFRLAALDHADTPATFGILVARFLDSVEFDDLRERTKVEYTRSLMKLRAEFGDLPFDALEDKRVRQDFKKYHARIAKGAARAADHDIAVLSRVLNYAIDESWLEVNWAFKIKKRHKANRADIVWETTHLAAFIDANQDRSNGFEICFALVLAAFTGQRQGDLLALHWDQIEFDTVDGRSAPVAIQLNQSKGGEFVKVPVHQDLAPWIAAASRKTETVLCNSRGQSWTESGFKASWQEAKARAKGCENIRFHDLRGTAVTRLADAGATTSEIAAVTGHKLNHVNDIIERYHKRTGVQAAHAIEKSQAAENLSVLRLNPGRIKPRA